MSECAFSLHSMLGIELSTYLDDVIFPTFVRLLPKTLLKLSCMQLLLGLIAYAAACHDADAKLQAGRLICK